MRKSTDSVKPKLHNYQTMRFKGSREVGMTRAVASQIIQAYERALESASAPPTGGVADTANLPYEKERIKQALIYYLRLTADTKIRELLKAAYMVLADWQAGVGGRPIDPLVGTVDRSTVYANIAITIASQDDPMETWRPAIARETDALKAELQLLGF